MLELLIDTVVDQYNETAAEWSYIASQYEQAEKTIQANKDYEIDFKAHTLTIKTKRAELADYTDNLGAALESIHQTLDIIDNDTGLAISDRYGEFERMCEGTEDTFDTDTIQAMKIDVVDREVKIDKLADAYVELYQELKTHDLNRDTTIVTALNVAGVVVCVSNPLALSIAVGAGVAIQYHDYTKNPQLYDGLLAQIGDYYDTI